MPVVVLQGVYRGLQDTRTPFYATVAANALNVVLGWCFIFGLHLGVRGAALATVTAQVRCNGRQAGHMHAQHPPGCQTQHYCKKAGEREPPPHGSFLIRGVCCKCLSPHGQHPLFIQASVPFPPSLTALSSTVNPLMMNKTSVCCHTRFTSR